MSKLLKYARVERERRFLLAGLPAGVDAASGYRELSDLYLDGTRLRLRLVTAPDGAVLERKLTQKLLGPDPRPERRILTTLYLDAAEFERLAALSGRRLAKRRHTLVSGGRPFAIDVFLGPLEGLVLAEIALEDEEVLRALAPPPFARADVTDVVLFTGGELARSDPAQVLAEARRRLGG